MALKCAVLTVKPTHKSAELWSYHAVRQVFDVVEDLSHEYDHSRDAPAVQGIIQKLVILSLRSHTSGFKGTCHYKNTMAISFFLKLRNLK